jgi:hypothetical protein
MLFNLKKEIKQQEMNELITESMSSKSNSEELIKSAFLDGFDIDIIGAENDPVIKDLVQTIPEYDDHDEEIESQINNIAESLLETQI